MKTGSNRQQNDLPSLSVRRPVLTAVIALLIMIAGLAAIPNVEVRELPDVDRPIVTVRAIWQGAAPETMDNSSTASVGHGNMRWLDSLERLQVLIQEP